MLLTARDGRALEVVVHSPGSAAGPAVVFCHGTPGAAHEYAPAVAAATERGLRWVSFARPGYAGSDRRPGRSVADVADDVADIADHLDLERFIALGWSGGGPHALACGARLAPRCAAVGLIASVAPYDGAAAAGLDWLDGMGPENHKEFGAAHAGEEPLRAYLDAERPALAQVTGPQVAEAFGGLVGPADVAVLTGDFADDVARSFRTGLAPGVDGWADDDLAFTRDWGFALADVRAPVSLWQGDDDRMVPFAHGPFLAARLPDVRPHLLPGEGHLSISLGMFDQILAETAELGGL